MIKIEIILSDVEWPKFDEFLASQGLSLADGNTWEFCPKDEHGDTIISTEVFDGDLKFRAGHQNIQDLIDLLNVLLSYLHSPVSLNGIEVEDERKGR